MLNINHENIELMNHFGRKFLFDGYLISSYILCDRHVILNIMPQHKQLNINAFLCDGYVITYNFLFDY
jgi:hypothetical protein